MIPLARIPILLAGLLLLGSLAPLASAGTDAQAMPLPVTRAVGAETIVALPALLAQPGGLDVAILAQFEQQGILQAGTTDALLAAAPPGAPSPPRAVVQDLHAVCDLDGDGVRDLISNDLTLRGPPSQATADSRIQALSGRDGRVLWTVDNMLYVRPSLPSGMSQERAGSPRPADAENVAALPDLDGDGVCEALAFGYDTGSRISVPFVGDPSVTSFATTVRVLSGQDGTTVWTRVLEGSRTSVSTFLISPARSVSVRGFPSGLLVYPGADGPRILVKTTDADFTEVQSPIGIPQPSIPGMAPLLRGRVYYETLTVTDRLLALDGDGVDRWSRELAPGSDARFTNLTWLSGAADLTGDGEPDVVLDQMAIANPRGTEGYNLVTDKALFEYGRGMRVVALDGASGEMRWTSVVLDPLAVQPNPAQEESHEVLAFTHAVPTGDLDGDGAPDVLASYVAREDGLVTSANGAFRTHLIPLRGTDGTALWDVRQQGWGFARPLDAPATRIGLGMVDVPSDPAPGGRFPAKFVRLLVLDAADGAIVWSYERAFTQNSYLSYNLALAQYATTLAPHDWDGDGLLDLLTPSQFSAATGRDQVLLATSSHTYDVKSGADGRTLHTLKAWGPEGRVVACDGAPDRVTVVSGHARRLDLTRFDADGAQMWRQPLWNDPAPRAATAAIDMPALGAACADLDAGRTLYGVNAMAFSFDRRHEVIALRGVVAPDGAAWMEPALRGQPSTSILLASVVPEDLPERPFPWAPIGVGAGLGTAAALVALLVAARSAALGRLLGVGVVLLVCLSGPAGALVGPATLVEGPSGSDAGALPRGSAPPPAATPSAVAPAPSMAPPSVRSDVDGGVALQGAQGRFVSDLIGLGDAWTPEAQVALAARFFHEMGYPVPAPSNQTPPGFDHNLTMSFTHPAGDLNGDGHGDVLLDQYCEDYVLCGGPTIFEPEVVLDNVCGTFHYLAALDGRTSELLWVEDISGKSPYTTCSYAFVLGTFPMPDGLMAPLVYEYTTYNLAAFSDPGPSVTLHNVSLLDPRTGLPLWTFSEKGTSLKSNVDEASNILLVPLIQAPTAADRMAFADAPQPVLFLQSIGYTIVTAGTIYPLPPFVPPLVVLDSYSPREWAARLDPATGEVLWRAGTFQPSPGRSEFPQVLDLREPGYEEDVPLAAERYWLWTRCCFDQSGDGVPDILYRVLEWSPTPTGNVQGPHSVDARVVAFDGADGRRLFDVTVAEDVPAAPDTSRHPGSFMNTLMADGWIYTLAAQATGDLDDDGGSDFLLHDWRYESDFLRIVSARSGKDGSELWRVESPRDLRTVVLGDANEDGAPDVLSVGWYGFENGNRFTDEYVAPAQTPLALRSGRDGTVLWRATTYQAPADVATYFDALLRNGFPDVNGDGVGDVVVDDPQYLGDQSVIHRLRVLSGRDASLLYEMRAVGAFALPSRVADLTGDGRDDLAVVSGDVNDLWATLHDGRDGSAVWARRVVSLPTSGYAQALPKLRFDTLDAPNGTAPGLLLTFHLDLIAADVYTVTYLNDDGPERVERIDLLAQTAPQILRVDGRRGSLSWALPAPEAAAVDPVVRGDTPGAKGYAELLRQAETLAEARATLPAVIPGALAFLAVFVLVLGAGLLAMRIRRADSEVPDLV